MKAKNIFTLDRIFVLIICLAALALHFTPIPGKAYIGYITVFACTLVVCRKRLSLWRTLAGALISLVALPAFDHFFASLVALPAFDHFFASLVAPLPLSWLISDLVSTIMLGIVFLIIYSIMSTKVLRVFNWYSRLIIFGFALLHTGASSVIYLLDLSKKINISLVDKLLELLSPAYTVLSLVSLFAVYVMIFCLGSKMVSIRK